MKKIIWILISLAVVFMAFFLGFNKKNSSASILYPVQIAGKWGYIDIRGNIAVEPVYNMADDFYDGVGIIQTYDNTEGSIKYGAVDSSGKLVVKPEYDYISRFDGGVAGAVNMEKDTYGFVYHIINKKGKSLCTLPENLEIYSMLHSGYYMPIQSDGMILVRNTYTEMYGYMNKNGKMIIPCNYYEGYNYSEGLALVKDKNSYRYIDKTGKVIIDASKYTFCRNFSEGLAAVALEGEGQAAEKYGYIDKKGNMKIKPEFTKAYAFSEGLAKVVKGESINDYAVGYIDKTGAYKTAVDLDDNEEETLFSEGLVLIDDGAGGYMNKEGKIMIAPVFEKEEDNYLVHNVAGEFRNGIAKISMSDGKTGYINKKGKYIWEPSS